MNGKHLSLLVTHLATPCFITPTLPDSSTHPSHSSNPPIHHDINTELANREPRTPIATPHPVTSEDPDSTLL